MREARLSTGASEERGTNGEPLAECLVVGAGPAGLTAALYLARYRRRVTVLHDGSARALRIPRTHNAPGFPEGVSGPDLIDRMQRHGRRYGAEFRESRIVDAWRESETFVIESESGDRWRGRTLILATGLQLNQLPLEHDAHEAAIAAGVLRYCPICDAAEYVGKRIGIVGCTPSGGNEALFLRRYSDRVTLVPWGQLELSDHERAALTERRIDVSAESATRFDLSGRDITVEFVSGAYAEFDVVFPALGVRPRTELAQALGLPVTEDGSVDAQAPFATEIPGLYSVGDVVDGLDQISVAVGHGAIAATKAHSWLREQDGECLPPRAGR